MPRSVQAFRQNATVTNSPATVGSGDPSSAIDDGDTLFQLPAMLDVCQPATSGSRNPFITGLNTMGGSTGNSTGVAGQTGNIMSGLQIFSDSLCGFALGGGTTDEVIAAWRRIREQADDPREVYRAVRKLRDTVGAGTTPQSVLDAVGAVNTTANANPLITNAIAKGIAAHGATGNQAIDGLNGSQVAAGTGFTMLSGRTKTGISLDDLLNASSSSLNQNTATHVHHKAATTAQSVSVTNQNLLVSQDFSAASTVAPDPAGNWAWDGTDGDPATQVLGCLSCTLNGQQSDYLSNEVSVVVGETIEVAATVKWSGLTFTGASPIILGVEKFQQSRAADGSTVYVDIGGFDVATVASPGSSSSGAWVGLAGTYVVEPFVDQIRLRFKIAKRATAGTVKWDNAEFLKTDLIADEAVPGVGMTVDSIVSNLYGAAGSGFTHNDAAVALGNTASSLASVSSKIASLEAEGSTGAIAGDDFNWTGAILSSGNWAGNYTVSDGTSYVSPSYGLYQANGTDATWVLGTSGSPGPRPHRLVTGLFQWQGTDSVSTTDYQLVQLVLDSSATYSGNDSGDIRVLGRVATSLGSYVELLIKGPRGNGAWFLNAHSSGVVTTLASGTCVVPGAGATISLYLGGKATTTPRQFTGLINSTTLFNFTESGTTSLFGSSNRGWGWGGSAATPFVGWVVPPSVSQWLALDQ